MQLAPLSGMLLNEIQSADALQLEADARLARFEIEPALTLYHKALRAGANPAERLGERWRCHMLLGDWAAAWHESDQTPQWVWNGTPLAGRHVMLRCYHGLGDTLQFIRFAPELKKTGASVMLEAQPQLVDFMRAQPWLDHVLTWEQPAPGFDTAIEVMELPYAFRVTPASVPADVPYLRVGQADAAHAADLLGSASPSGRQPRIGIIFRASAWDDSRSIGLAPLARLIAGARADFYALQIDAVAQTELEAEPIGAQIHNLGSQLQEIGLTAAVMQRLDLIISVDAMLAHLAGALGRPTLLLLKHDCDWRWGMAGAKTPWYPTMRLIRQLQPGNWSAVTAQLERELANFGVEISTTGALK